MRADFIDRNCTPRTQSNPAGSPHGDEQAGSLVCPWRDARHAASIA
jgi:hypothetical protein